MAKIVCIGGSTGSPNELIKLLRALPTELPPIVVALHMPGSMTGGYAKSLANQTAFKASLAEYSVRPQPGWVYVGPGGMHVGFGSTGRMVVTENPAQTHFKPAIDVLFYTAAKAFGAAVVAVVLTGLSAYKDGVEGAKAVKQARGKVLVVDDPASNFIGMPKNVIAGGGATDTAKLAEMPQKLIHLLR